ncbi:tail fiber assembly protein [Yersinia vastinensis]|uniref:tail fiber assembly protein n=1 Tax=Yersinia vastinensis TaxID=2890318 RepID=UPI003850CF50
MKYIYDAKTNAFYPQALKDDYLRSGTWPDAGVEVDEETFALYTGEPPAGMVRGSVDGMPSWVDAPLPNPPDAEQLISEATEKKHQLKIQADSEIEWRQDAVDGGYAEPDEVTALAAWKKYRVLLMRIDTSKTPEIEWPRTPE